MMHSKENTDEQHAHYKGPNDKKQAAVHARQDRKKEQQPKDMNLSKDQEKSVRNELLFANTICHDIKSPSTSSAQKQSRSQVIRNLVSGKTTKRCRMIETLTKKTG